LRDPAGYVKVIPAMTERSFTIEEANSQLLWLEATFDRLDLLREELTTRHANLLELFRQRSGNGAASKDHEVLGQQETVEGLTQQLRREMQEITEMGIIARDMERGLVDFPSHREGRDILLCWVRGEKSIGFWHGTNEGFASRKRL
jgi:hypothetical protein